MEIREAAVADHADRQANGQVPVEDLIHPCRHVALTGHTTGDALGDLATCLAGAGRVIRMLDICAHRMRGKDPGFRLQPGEELPLPLSVPPACDIKGWDRRGCTASSSTRF